VDNLIVSYHHMSRLEYAAIWAIFSTVVLADLMNLSFALLLAVVVGLVFSTIIFMLQYAQVSVIRNTYQGDGYQSKVVRTYWEEALISRVGCRSGYIQLEGFIFFASAAQVMDGACLQEDLFCFVWIFVCLLFGGSGLWFSSVCIFLPSQWL
jgi:MFS superfamily sulfate permease-like transporter